MKNRQPTDAPVLRRILLVIAYDGSNYCGWQVQPNGVSIQSVLQRAIEDLVGEPVMLTGASRTDSGVHALGQVAVFDTHMSIPEDRFAMALNQRLPKDIVIQKSVEVALNFHPRYQKVSKTYEYKILNRRIPLPCQRLYSYFVPQRLDLEAMRQGAAYICGTHDFKNFASTKTSVKDTVRTVYDLKLEKEGDMITLTISGDGFLYNMVRIIAGALLKVGFRQKSPEYIREVLESSQRLIPGPTAPAHGLTLVEICYKEGLKKP
ncbi:tRNA pseudouridine(38-40) synthase TruA [Catenibacillus scindens]|uniref:tRNA pseudouridine(38-40) synthase TruA n=1 Tax=Catenibacillus scindens TaxID=673271 RepID=UPI00320AEA5B